MSLRRGLAIALLAAGSVLSSGRAAVALCTAGTCSASALIANCCSGNSCTLDGTVTVTPPPGSTTCDLDFGARNLTLTGTLLVGSNIVTIEAATFRISGSGLVNARGPSGSPGGTVTFTLAGGSAPVFGMAATASTGIDASGYVLGGGTVHVQADGPVSLTSGGLTANALDADGSGGTITVDAGTGTITVGTSVFANAGLGGTGGTIEFSTEGDLTVTDGARVSATAGAGLGGEIDLHAGGALAIAGSATIQANAASGSASDGGEINMDGASVQVNGLLSATGGGDSTGDAGGSGGSVGIEATTGALQLTKGSQAITVDGAGGGEGGEVSLITDAPTHGTITIAAPISAQGLGGLANRPAGGGSVDAEAAAGLSVARIINVNGVGEATGEVNLSAGEDVTINNKITGVDPVGGGILTVASAHDVVVADVGLTSNLTMTCGGSNNASGPGGAIGILAENSIVVTGFTFDVSASGIGAAGSLDLDAGRDITLDSKTLLKANSAAQSGAVGGAVTLTAGAGDGFGVPQTGDLRIDGEIDANGHAPSGTAGPASIQLSGCQVTLGSTALVDSTGDADSTNTVIGRASITSITVSGKLKAMKSNIAIYRSDGSLPQTSGTVTPGFTKVAKPPCTAPNQPIDCLVPCPICGDNVVTSPWEDCDPPGCANGCDVRCRKIVPTGCSDGNACTADLCDSTFGCLNEPLPNGSGCDDGNACTVGETCQDGVCSGQLLSCDDGNPCTIDTCDHSSGCQHTPVTCADDGNACNGVETCSPTIGCHHGTLVVCPPGNVCDPATGNCVVKNCTPATQATDCNDGNPCTVDTCPSGACINTPVPDGPAPGCGDSNVCNGTETCQTGVCTPGTPLQIDDGDPCTQDTCDPALGLRHTPILGCCAPPLHVCPGSSDNPCTQCVDNECVVAPDCCASDVDCQSQSACTTADTCNSSTHQCEHNPASDGNSCGDVCNPGTCQSGTCVPGTPLPCPPDTDICTDDYCDPVAGCVHPPIPGCCSDDTQCDDHDPCTLDDRCDLDAHACSHTPIVDCSVCTTDTDCDPSGACGQRICDTAGGVCVPHTPPDCTDGNPKTQDSCVVDGPGQAHCEHVYVCQPPCDDHNACNGVETCTATGCAAGTPPNCDGNDPCMAYACDPASGCTQAPLTGYPSVECRLGAIASALLQAPGTATTRKLSKLLGKARTKLAAARGAAPKRAQKSLKIAGASLNKLVKAVTTARRKNKIDGGLADAITTAAQGAMAALEALKASVAP